MLLMPAGEDVRCGRRGVCRPAALPKNRQGCFSLDLALVSGPLEIVSAGEWISAWTDERWLLLKVTDIIVVVVEPRELFNWGAAMEEMPIILLQLGDPVPVMVLGDPDSFGHVWFRRSPSCISQPRMGEGAA